MEIEDQEKEIRLCREPYIIGGGAVDSVNGYTGDVILTTSDLENTSDYQTGDEVSASIAQALAGKEQIIILTEDDYSEYPAGVFSVHLWLLDDGIYYAPTGINISMSRARGFNGENSLILIKKDLSFTRVTRLGGSSFSDATNEIYNGIVQTETALNHPNLADGTEIYVYDALTSASLVQNLTTDSALRPLAAGQGRALKNLIDSLVIKNQGAPTTSTEGTVGKLIEDVTNGELYICTGITGGVYTWEKVGGATYTAGTNIQISSGNVISATDTTYTAGTNVSISAQNVISATDTTYNDFVGTDGMVAGTAGLVPAPATTDADKFLKSDGSWDTAGGGGDVVYSTKTTSNDSQGGAIYIGDKNATQSVVNDPTTTDNHYRYFWAMPFNSSIDATTIIPGDETINIGGVQGNRPNEMGGGTHNVTIGYRSKSGTWADGQTVIGWQAQSRNSYATAYGANSNAYAQWSTAIGYDAQCWQQGSVALGKGAYPTRQGEVNIGADSPAAGYNNTNYRVIGGVHDPVDAHDAATKGYVDAHAGGGVTTYYISPTDYNDIQGGPTTISLYKESALTNSANGGEIYDALMGGPVRFATVDTQSSFQRYHNVFTFDLPLANTDAEWTNHGDVEIMASGFTFAPFSRLTIDISGRTSSTITGFLGE